MLSIQDTQDTIRNKCIEMELNLPSQIAYILATVQWETAGKFLPVREAFWLTEEWRKRNLRYYPYYGRGYVQITWKYNYSKYAAILGIDLVNEPDLALEPEHALFILVHGFKHGAFTGKRIASYLNSDKMDFFNCRRCINGVDHAQDIADIAIKYLEKEAPLWGLRMAT